MRWGERERRRKGALSHHHLGTAPPCTEHGQAYVELMLVLPLFLLTVAALIFFGRVLYVKIALDMASYDACRAAVEAMDGGAGMSQGYTAGVSTLQGFYLNASAASLSIAPQGAWQRGTPVVCQASFNLFIGDIPVVSQFVSGRSVNLQSETWSRVETWRSYWR